MSKWTEVRDGLVAAMDVKEITEAAKNQLTRNLIKEGMPVLEEVTKKFIEEIQKQADNENGWNKIRDKFVLPLLINGVVWIADFVLIRSTETTIKDN
ncbi:hypothetical protein [Veillonella magna]|uniref:Uncharacterized protein n=1 Tax=Veillonella magna TaxID=464322 RepID=A0ABS2GGK2_9FIRM|nr:hypothetical protein [Veillonella magna]MBM6824978.1 hypothetical protein [Veillonella magna]MBM6913304.1 hypothetical protein [Veillonella magna]